MKEYAIVLLPVPERRALKEALVWFGDGWRLLKLRLAAWTTYAVVAILALVMASMTGAVIARLGGEQPSVWFDVPRLLLVSVVVVAVQAGMYRGMTRIAQGESLGQGRGATIRLEDMGWMFSAPQRKHLLMFAVLMVGFNVLFMQVELWVLGGQELLVPDAQGQYVMEGARFSLNEAVFWRYALLMAGYTVLMWMLTWAAVPLMTLFADVPPARALWLAADGFAKNVLPLLALGLLMFLVSVGVGLAIGVVAGMLQLLAVPLFALFAVWMLPLSGAWGYAACRHVFTDW